MQFIVFTSLYSAVESVQSQCMFSTFSVYLTALCQHWHAVGWHCFIGLDELRETVEKLKLQVAESTRQESLLVMRLAAKEQEVQELLVRK